MTFKKGQIPWNTNQRTGKYFPCDNCGTIVYKLPCEFKKLKHHFCSQKCNIEFLEGKPRSKETKEKIGIANKGKTSWCKGKLLVDIDPVHCAFLYQVKNLSIADIAKWFGCYRETVDKRLRSCGVSIKNPKERTKGRFHREVDNEKILDLYTNHGYSAKEIAEIFDCDSSVIFNRLKCFGVKIREPKESVNMERRVMKFKQCKRGGWKLGPRSEQQKEILKQKGIERWKDPKMREKMLKGARKGMEKARTSPSGFEQKVMKVVPKNVRFVGNGKFWIPIKNGKYKNRNPDFIVEPFKKTKKVVEVLGGYFHDPIFTKELWWDHQERITNEYKSAGVECFCIWYFDFYDDFSKDIIIYKLEEFANGS